MQTKIITPIAIVLLGILGLIVQRKHYHRTRANRSHVEANIKALTTSIPLGKGATTYPIAPWHYVPDRYLESTLKTFEVVCTNKDTLSVDGEHIPGDYIVGERYAVSVGRLLCTGQRKGAWCDQRKIINSIIYIDTDKK